jgi:hypothetical protein
MNTERLLSRTLATGFAAVVLGLTGCAASTPTIDMSPDAEVTYDGLREVKGSRADEAWARPGVDLSQYTKIALQGAGIEYRPGGETGRSLSARSRGGPYEVTEEQKERLRNMFIEVFVEELGKSKYFTLVSEPGPDVLLIRAGLLDVVSWVPPEPFGRGEVYISQVGDATLVLELRDSITETILARAVDRRAIDAGGITDLSYSSPVSNQADVKRVARSWARLLRERLDTYGAREE